MKQYLKKTVNPKYRPQSDDISVETDLLIVDLLRQRTPAERLMMAASLTRSARELSLCSLRQQFGYLKCSAFLESSS